MRVEVVAVGTELLLGQIVDTNSAVIGERLAAHGVDCTRQVRVGDNHGRMVAAFRDALRDADAVIVCGGLGPTDDDVTREAIAEVMGVALAPDAHARELLDGFFAARGAAMPVSNLRQALVPEGATVIPQVIGTAPGLVCPVGEKVLYALPGVPSEMVEMLDRAVVPDLTRRMGGTAVIASRTVRTVGIGEARVGEMVAPRLRALDAEGPGAPTIAFLASAVDGVKVRITVKAGDADQARARLDAEEGELRLLLGDAVYGSDDVSMEEMVGRMLVERGLTLAVAESFTGGLVAARVVSVPGASAYFRGGVVAYSEEIKFGLLGVPHGPVVSLEAAAAMAEGVRRALGADAGIATTGVAGPDPQEGVAPGTAFLAAVVAGGPVETQQVTLPGSRERAREAGSLRALDLLRRRVLDLA